MAEIHEVCIGNDEQSDCGIDRETRKLIKDLNCRVALLEEQQVVLPDMLGDEHRLAEVEERLTALESKSQSATVVSHHASAETLWTLSRAEIRLAELETLDAGTRLAAVEAALTASPLHQSGQQCRFNMSDIITEQVTQYAATFWKSASAAFHEDLAKLMADIRQIREHDMKLQHHAGDKLSKQLRDTSGKLERRLEALEKRTVKGVPAGLQQIRVLHCGADASRSIFVVEPAEEGGGPAGPPVLPRFVSDPVTRHTGVAGRCDSRRS